MGCAKILAVVWLLGCVLVACGATSGMVSMAPSSMSPGDILPGSIGIWFAVFGGVLAASFLPAIIVIGAAAAFLDN